MNTDATVGLRHAATVLLLREQDREVEALLLRRHLNLKFLADTWAFPGGGLSTADCDAPALARLIGVNTLDPAQYTDLALSPLAPPLVAGLLIAACRETFEETGVLLAQHADGRPCDSATVARLQSERAAVDADAAAFTQLLERENLFLNAAHLIYWAHWITPSAIGPRRYDTRFFVMALPADQNVSALSGESAEAQWMRPLDVYAAAERREMRVPAPTVTSLEDVQTSYEQAGSIARMLERERDRRVLPLLPKAIDTDSGKMVVLPWDADYQSTPGEGTSATIEFPPGWRGLPSRRRFF
jgi:8-oxo-dGTP pyrophosphatase MutT (NUDIX family)